MSLWVPQPDQAAMLDLDAMMWYWNSSVQVTCTSLRKQEKKLETNTPKRTAGWIWRTNVYVSDLKKSQAFEITRFSFWDQSFGTDERTNSVKGFRWVCTKTRAMDRTVCNLFLFPKKPYCYCNIMKNINVVLWRFILHYIVDFLFSFWFSFLTEMLYHIF